MKEESDTSSNEVLERIASRHLLSPHNHLLVTKQDSPPPLASSTPSPASVSSITSISKVSSSTNGNGTPLSNVTSLAGPLKRPKSSFDAVDIVRAQLYGNALVTIGNDLAAAAAAASGLSFPPISAEQSRLLMQELANVAARTALSSTNSTRSKSSSSDGSNAGSPLSSLSLSVNPKTGAKPRSADSPGSGSMAGSTTASREKVFVCQICNRSFGYKHVLQNHERTHTGEKPFECRECHKRFTRDHHLKTHMRLHTGEKPYHCTHCDRQFVQVANLRRHLRVHTGERPYACELCTSRFSDSNQLKAHMLIHKGEKPFECTKCMGRFRRRHHLMHHKCPKDEANVGKPRRGRRPKAYDQLQSPSPNSLSSSRPGSADELLAHLPLLAATAAVSSTTVNPLSGAFYHHASKPPASHHMPHLRPPPLHHPLSSPPPTSLPPTAHHGRESPPKSRRKPRHTIRILSQPQHSDLYNDLDCPPEADVVDDDENGGTVQTQPLNLSISPGLNVSNHLSLNTRRAYNNGATTTTEMDVDVLDLSRSRSDAESEPEPIEEDEDDDEDDVLVKDEDDEDIEDGVLLNGSDEDIENGQNTFKPHHRLQQFTKHYSNNHINSSSNNNNNRTNNTNASLFAAKLQGLDSGNLLEAKGNGISSLELAAAFTVAQMENRKSTTSTSNGVPILKSDSDQLASDE